MKQPMTREEIAAIVQAVADGKEIEGNALINNGLETGWINIKRLYPSHKFSFDSLEYRIAPESRSEAIQPPETKLNFILNSPKVSYRISHFRTFYSHKSKQTVYLPPRFRKNKDFKLITNGGYTICRVFDSDKNLLDEQVSFCHHKDTFCYKSGKHKALELINLPVEIYEQV